MPKPCKHCGKTTHFSFQCFFNPKRKEHPVKTYKRLARQGKVARGWADAKKRWYMAHPAKTYNCHYCGRFLLRGEVELDHFESRARRPDLRYELTNLVPCCTVCNRKKGSRSGNEFSPNDIERL